MFKVGDVIKLAGGGPNMTVYDVDDDKLKVNWFNAALDIKTAIFPKSEWLMLVPVEVAHPYRDRRFA